MNGNNSFDSEGNFVKAREEGVGFTMANGGSDNNGKKISWNTMKDVATYLIYPVFIAMFYLLMQITTFDRRLIAIEVSMLRPPVDLEMVKKIAIIEDRQNRNTAKIDSMSIELERHREISTYDNPNKKRY